MDHVSLQPAAGAQGELAGVLMIRAYHLSRGERRHKVLIPDSAHGTNPASTALAGFSVVELKSGRAGEVDLGDLERHLDEDVAAFMITQPNTLGLFESRIHQITEMCHAKGVQVYMDGANFNAILGITRPGRPRASTCATSTCTRRSRRRTAAAGPGRARSASRRTSRRSCRRRWSCRTGRPLTRSTGSGRSPSASSWRSGATSACWCAAYAYIRTMGPDGLRSVSENAVLNANYVLRRLEGDYDRSTAGAVHARVRRVGAAAEASRRDRHGHRQAAPRPGLLRALDVLPADRRGGADDRADRDGVAGDARRSSATP